MLPNITVSEKNTKNLFSRPLTVINFFNRHAIHRDFLEFICNDVIKGVPSISQLTNRKFQKLADMSKPFKKRLNYIKDEWRSSTGNVIEAVIKSWLQHAGDRLRQKNN
ncbi:hypothetical protein PV328_007769 [Microctonus aethiopoides]|uniref:Uncharacterized protein n=1 Tax=Microctonus aethiopoides TaxID=144406 RepID=A0AA39C9Y2_9HYME|nr:hypothetical protein PV328_007769 [Microctonus aethiopoides]